MEMRVINHGFGYETLYAHMHKITARVGQSVKRGDVIGEVGNTGKSTDLTFITKYTSKVRRQSTNYYFLDLSPEEYDIMLQLSQNAGQVFD